MTPNTLKAAPHIIPLKMFYVLLKENMALTLLLYNQGIGTPGSRYNLYGDGGWVKLTKSLNPHVTNWEFLESGTVILLPLPATLAPTTDLRSSSGLDSGQSGSIWELYQNDKVQTLLQILHERGAKHPSRLRFDDQLIRHIIGLNQSLIDDWRVVPKGAQVLLEFPTAEPSGSFPIHIAKAHVIETMGLKPDQIWQPVYLNREQILQKAAEIRQQQAEAQRQQEEKKQLLEEQKRRQEKRRQLLQEKKRRLVAKRRLQEDMRRQRQEQRRQEEIRRRRQERRQQRIVAEAKHRRLDELVSLPEEKLEDIPPEILEEKLTEDKIATLSEQEVQKLPPKVKEKKAWKVSFWDSFKPGMNRLFSDLEKSTPSVFIGLRYGIPLVASRDSVTANLNFFGLLTEFRGGWLNGLRTYWDYAPATTVEVDGEDQSMSWQRVLVGYAFEWNLPTLFDKFHFSPKIGSYGLRAKLPVIFSDTIATDDVDVKNGLSMGVEIDLELAQFFYIARFWAAQDVSSAILLRDSMSSVTSRRLGTDFFVKGSGFTLFGTDMSLSYLAFVSHDTVQIKTPSDDAKTINMQIPYVGLGGSLSW